MIYFISIIVIVLTIFFYRNTVPQIDKSKRTLLVFLRSSSLIIILILLLNPILYLVRSELNKPEIIILNDVSDSMFLISADSTKIDRLISFKRSLLEKYSSGDYKILNYDFAAGLKGNSSNTFLIKTLEDLLKTHKTQNIDEIFLFSDGWLHDESMNALKNLEIPISTFYPDYVSTEFDLEIKTLKFNRTFFQDELNTIIVDLAAENYSGKAKLNFFVENQLISSKNIDFSESNFQQVFFEHSFNNTGLYPIEFSLIPEIENEINTANNFYPSAINVLKEKSKILIISDKLTWDVKFQQEALKRNQRWKTEFLLKQNILKSKNKNVDLEDQIQNTDVVILINNSALHLTAEEGVLIQNHLNRGGGLFLQGRILQELENIIPATDAGINRIFSGNLLFTKESSKYESFNFPESNISKDIPPVRYFYVNSKLQSEILAEINNENRSAAILFSEFNQGKILYFTFLDLWKWQMRENDSYYQNFISDLCDWLGQSQTNRFISFTNKNSYFTGETIRIDLQAFDEKLNVITNLNAKLTLTNKNNELIEEQYMNSGEDGYFLDLTDLPADEYSYTIIDEERSQQTSGKFIVTEDNPENRDKDFNTPLLAFISEISGGHMYSQDKLESLSVPQAEINRTEFKIELPVYKKWYLIAFFLISFCLEIFLRKRWGLL
ncbi:MAG: hypothetical protein APR54_06210 [Candidatus Cloacimonas sp. SDB]|nr:MAG: hypothetical protein APR54_06210 [Candidatus Cloacimonas sp. SDB]